MDVKNTGKTEETTIYKIEKQYWELLAQPQNEKEAKIMIDKYKNEYPFQTFRIVKYTTIVSYY